MKKKIKISAGKVETTAELNDSTSAAALWQALPITGVAQTWGNEIYFSIPLELEPEDPKAIVTAGDLGYWPPSSAFCIFFGPTPASRGNEIRPASPVNLMGRACGEARVFKKVKPGDKVLLARAED
ncbi:MAG: hypothetical protein HY669_03515 [Chloroflexi bacterium]|nr:hypothetical protein [Chloroflexota bacterium]